MSGLIVGMRLTSVDDRFAERQQAVLICSPGCETCSGSAESPAPCRTLSDDFNVMRSGGDRAAGSASRSISQMPLTCDMAAGKDGARKTPSDAGLTIFLATISQSILDRRPMKLISGLPSASVALIYIYTPLIAACPVALKAFADTAQATKMSPKVDDDPMLGRLAAGVLRKLSKPARIYDSRASRRATYRYRAGRNCGLSEAPCPPAQSKRSPSSSSGCLDDSSRSQKRRRLAESGGTSEPDNYESDAETHQDEMQLQGDGHIRFCQDLAAGFPEIVARPTVPVMDQLLRNPFSQAHSSHSVEQVHMSST